jgi:type IV pilus assembly protein PilC
MKAPIFGNLTIKNACSKFARTMSTLLAAGIPMIEALDITSTKHEQYSF